MALSKSSPINSEVNQNTLTNSETLILKLDKIADRLEKIGVILTNRKDFNDKKSDEEFDNFGTFKDFARGFAKGFLAPILPFYNPFEKKKIKTEDTENSKTNDEPIVKTPITESNILTTTVAELSKGNTFQEKMLEELTIIRKISEGSLSFNRKTLKYTDHSIKKKVSRDVAKAREEDIYIDDKGKANVRKIESTSSITSLIPLSPSSLDPSDFTEKEKIKAEDRELLAEAIAKKLAQLLGNNQSGPTIDIERNRKPSPPDSPNTDRKTPTSEPKNPTSEKPTGPTGGGGSKPKPGIPKIGGALFGLGAIGMGAYEIGQIQKDKEEKKIDEKKGTEQQAGIVGGIAGAGAGAAIGAGIGSVFGGFGAIPGAIIGGALGGYGGNYASKTLANALISSGILQPKPAANTILNYNMPNSNLVEPKPVANAVLKSNIVEQKLIKPASVDSKGFNLTELSNMQEQRFRTYGAQNQSVVPINNTSIVNNNTTEYVPIKGTPRNNDPSIIKKLDQINDYR